MRAGVRSGIGFLFASLTQPGYGFRAGHLKSAFGSSAASTSRWLPTSLLKLQQTFLDFAQLRADFAHLVAVAEDGFVVQAGVELFFLLLQLRDLGFDRVELEFIDLFRLG